MTGRYAAAQLLAELRLQGWAVAAHNDYRQNGGTHTFYLLTHPCGVYIKAEGALGSGEGEEGVLLRLTEQAEGHRCVVRMRCDKCGNAGLIEEGLLRPDARCDKCSGGGFFVLDGMILTDLHAGSPTVVEVTGAWPGRVTARVITDEQLRLWRYGSAKNAGTVHDVWGQVVLHAVGEPPAQAAGVRYRWRYEVLNTLMHEAAKEIRD